MLYIGDDNNIMIMAMLIMSDVIYVLKYCKTKIMSSIELPKYKYHETG
jgi:hypothetical protein